MSRFSWSLALLTLLWCALCAVSCESRPVAPAKAPRPAADLRLFVLTDPRGYLEPCGCQQRPLGGVDKLAASLEAGRRTGVPSLFVAAGDLTFGVELKPEDVGVAQNQERWRAETLVDVWSRLGMTAATPGPLDFAADDARNELAARGKFPWLVENVSDAAGAPLPGTARAQIVSAGAVKVGLFGLVAPTPALRLPEGATVDGDLAALAARTSAALRGQGAQVVVALLHADRRSARQVAARGVDVVVMGGIDAEEPSPPALHEGAILVNAGRQGQRLVTVDLTLKAGPWQDESAWTREAKKRELGAERADLAAKIASWEKDAKVAKSDLEAMRAKLAGLDRALAEPALPRYDGHWFTAEVLELAPEVAGDKAVAALLDAHDKRVNEANAKIVVPPLPVPEGAPTYVGSEACKSCHEAAYAWWRTTKHGHAYATLVERNKQFNLACVGCHVVGYHKPGGATVSFVENLKDVGCESCHGPSSFHVAKPDAPGLVARDTPREVCMGCHTHEHSPRFVYDAFRTLLIVPGHGQPAGQAAKAGAK